MWLILPVGQSACKTNWDDGTRIIEAEVVFRTENREREVLHREILAAADDVASSVAVVVAVAVEVGSKD